MFLRVRPWVDRWVWRFLVLEACTCLMVVKLMVRFVPFRFWAGDVGGARGVSEPGAEGERLARRIGAAVNRAAALLPLQVVCLPRALVARFMLRRRRLTASLRFAAGVQKAHSGGPAIRGHAWLTLGSIVVIGGGAPPGYAGFGYGEELPCPEGGNAGSSGP